jgi:ectoine hydroxylase-related dioxygenase (phytanoyl-CoA dioxygenase family)
MHFIKLTVKALKGQNRQTVHADLLHDHQDFPFAMVVNILLVDTSVKNGATEIWLGTHKRGNKGMAEILIDEESLEERRKICPPIRAVLKKGSLIIRDLRLWHAGIPNQTDIPRIMLSMVFNLWEGNCRFIFRHGTRTA